jgi:hypothetical protein
MGLYLPNDLGSVERNLFYNAAPLCRLCQNWSIGHYAPPSLQLRGQDFTFLSEKERKD